MIICNHCHGENFTDGRCDSCLERNQALLLTKDEIMILSDHLSHEYMTQEEPARSVLIKIHNFARLK